MKRVFEYAVEDKYIMRPVKDVLLNRFSMSGGLVTSLKKNPEGIMVNNERQNVTYLFAKGDILKITIEEEASANIEPVEIPLNIIYEDEDLLAINKPYGMPTHTSMGHRTDTLANGVLYYLNKTGEPHTFHAVTRLDKDTSGIVLIAKNRYTHDLLSRLLRRDKIDKKYFAIICGRLEGEGVINAPIDRISDSIIKRGISKDGLEAITHYKSVIANDEYSAVNVMPKTGRTHQIRVHMSSIGHPLAGDDMYGGIMSAKRHMLHCSELSFIHPITRKNLVLCAELSADIVEFCSKNKLEIK